MVAKPTISAIDSVTERVRELFEQKSRAVVDMDVLGSEMMPIDMMQDKPMQQAIFILEDHYRNRPMVYIGAETPVRFNPADLRNAVVPDVVFAEDVDSEPIRTLPHLSYIIWEIGKPPDFALELASPSTYENDVLEKPGVCERIGIPEYWMFDPTGGDLYGQTLTGRSLVNGSYEMVDLFENQDGLVSGYSEALGLNLCCANRDQRAGILSSQPNVVFQQDDYNPVQLMFQDPATGLYLLNAEGRRESEREAQEARQRAESRALDAEEEREAAESRALDAEAELARLRDQIRRLEQG